jgi:hypothetical protein
MHVPAPALAGGHGATLLCRQGHALKQKRAAEEDIRKAREVLFSVRGVPIESVSTFLYIGRQLSSTDDDWPDVVKNLAKSYHISGINPGYSHSKDIINVL